MPYRCTRRTGAAFAIGVLCAALSLGSANAKEQQKAERPPDGLVVGRLVHNMSRINVFFGQFTLIRVKGGPTNSTVTLLTAPPPSTLGARQSTLHFAELLPAGRYQLTELGAMLGTMSSDSRLVAPLPSFEVTAGGVTDLGLLVVQPTGR